MRTRVVMILVLGTTLMIAVLTRMGPAVSSEVAPGAGLPTSASSVVKAQLLPPALQVTASQVDPENPSDVTENAAAAYRDQLRTLGNRPLDDQVRALAEEGDIPIDQVKREARLVLTLASPMPLIVYGEEANLSVWEDLHEAAETRVTQLAEVGDEPLGLTGPLGEDLISSMRDMLLDLRRGAVARSQESSPLQLPNASAIAPLYGPLGPADAASAAVLQENAEQLEAAKAAETKLVEDIDALLPILAQRTVILGFEMPLSDFTPETESLLSPYTFAARIVDLRPGATPFNNIDAPLDGETLEALAGAYAR